MAGKRTLYAALFFVLCLLQTIIVGAAAQDYNFEVQKAEVIFWVENDGNVSISYDYLFNNRGKGLDYIDIGLPNDSFDLKDVSAEIDGAAVSSSKISRADYSVSGLRHGVTVDNTGSPIPSGAAAEFYLVVKNIGKLLYDAQPDEQVDVPYAGFNFQPNFFGSQFVNGKTDMTVRLVLPTGIEKDAPYYIRPDGWVGSDEPFSDYTDNGNIVYEWSSANADSSDQYTFGALFPKSVLTATDQIVSKSDDDGNAGSSGFDAFIDDYFEIICCGGGVFAIFLYGWIIGKREKKRKKRAASYMPPSIERDGSGIKRGLTAVEAAVLLEEPLDKVISMIVFSLTKKEVIQVVSTDPFKINVKEELPEGLRSYETDFIEGMSEEDVPARKQEMTRMMKSLILSVADKLKGFDIDETKSYYRSIIAKAWKQVQEADTPDMKGKVFDKNFGWAMLDDDLDQRAKEAFPDTEVYLPTWWWRMGPSYRPYYGPSGPTMAGSPMPANTSGSGGNSGNGGGTPSIPVLPGAMLARSLTDSVRGIGEKTVGSVSTFTNSVRGSTNPAPAPVTKSDRHGGSSGSSGGSSCACACACASCACACAWGGR